MRVWGFTDWGLGFRDWPLFLRQCRVRMLVFAPVVAATVAWGLGFIIGIRAYGLRFRDEQVSRESSYSFPDGVLV